MATFLDIYNRQFADPAFSNRVTVAITQNAKYIIAQEQGHPNEANRRAWAAEAITNPARTLARIMVWVVTNSHIVDVPEPDDAAINAAVGEAIDPIASAFRPGVTT